MTAQHHTAQHQAEQPDVQQPAPERTDPLGPIMLPKRSKVGARAMALVGTVGLSALRRRGRRERWPAAPGRRSRTDRPSALIGTSADRFAWG